METLKFYLSNYLEFYNDEIRPNLHKIDIFIKSQENENKEINIKDISNILGISQNEILEILNKFNIKKINIKNFFLIMENGSSKICTLYKREKQFNNTIIYSKKQISYIYNIDIKLIESACRKLNLDIFTSKTLKILFKEIPFYRIIKNKDIFS